MRSLAALALLGLTGCPADTTGQFEQCELDLVLDLDEATPGDTVVASGRPLTDSLDTVVRVDGVDAVDVEVVITDSECDTCDDCRATAACGVCETCGICAEACADCAQSVSFTVPDLAPGPVGVAVFNAFGASPALPLRILESPVDDEQQ